LLRQLGVGVPDTDPLYLATGLEVLAKLDTREALQAYGGPQLHLFAGSDALVPAEAAKALSELLPDVEVGLVEDSSHAFLLEYPQELAAGIKSFCMRVAMTDLSQPSLPGGLPDKRQVAASFSAAASYDSVAALQRAVA
jgi:hypothetical protein